MNHNRKATSAPSGFRARAKAASAMVIPKAVHVTRLRYQAGIQSRRLQEGQRKEFSHCAIVTAKVDPQAGQKGIVSLGFDLSAQLSHGPSSQSRTRVANASNLQCELAPS